ncbi:MAG TPA: DNA primase, partial [Solirubrobacteraceae bacterium]
MSGGRFADDARERVRQAADILQVVGQRVELTRRGANSFFGRCPFHDERTPSFHVRPAEGAYYCFGCGAKGDVFRFVEETEGVRFPEAMEILADRFGVELERVEEDPHAAQRREREKRLLTLLDRAAEWYARVLWDAREAAPAREYLAGRGLEEAALRDFRVGYAPSGWDRLVVVTSKAGFTEEDLLAAGLASRRRSGEGLVDRFRERIVFPLADERGRVRGFGARAMSAEDQPKYLNSSDGEIFHKGRQLFGIDRARRSAAAAGRAVLAEGYTDVIALHQAGVGEAVGIMGTSLTEDQVGILARIAPQLILALDADAAGQEAMLRAAELVSRRQLELRVVGLPEGQDPADLLVADGAEALRARIGRSIPFVVFRVERTLARADTGTAEGRDEALVALRPVLAAVPPSVLREELVRRVAGVLDLSEALVASLPAGTSAARPLPVVEDPAEAPAVVRKPSPREEVERDYLAVCLALPGPGAESLQRLNPELHFTSALTRRAAVHLASHLVDPFAGLDAGDEDLGALLAELAGRYRSGEVRVDSLEYNERILERGRLEREIARAKAT